MSVNGLLILDKPAGMTSHDVVARLRRILGEKSVGHLGTLDPMATGVLPMVLGNYTRLAQFFGDSVKGYEGEIRFGFMTDTYDAEGEEQPRPATFRQAGTLTVEVIREAAKTFTGNIRQLPPPFSAKKIGGVPAYKLARRNQEVQLKPVDVVVHELDILGFDGERASFRALVSSGTYIRSIAQDLGQTLRTGAHLTKLRRTRAGEFSIEDAHSLEQLEAAGADTDELFVHPRRILPEMPSVTATPDMVSYIRNGRAVNLPDYSSAPFVKVFAGQRNLIAVARRVAGTLFHPKVVLAASNEAVEVR